MAKKTIRPADDEDEDRGAAPEPAPPSGSRWLLSLLLVLAGAALVAWFAPAIVAATPMRDALLESLLGGYPGKLRVDSLSLGWLAPIEATGVTLEDPRGETLCTVARAVSTKSLLALALDPQQLGGVTVDKAHLRLNLRPDGSNLEDAIGEFLKLLPAESAAASPECVVTLTDGTAEVRDLAAGQSWKLTKLAGEAQLALQPTLKFSGVLDDPQGVARTVQATWTWGPKAILPTEAVITDGPDETPPAAAAVAGPSVGTLRIEAQACPLAPLRALAARGLSDITLAGEVTGEVSIEMRNDTGPWAYVATGSLQGKEIQVGSPSLVGRERVEFSVVKASGAIGLEGQRVAAENLFVESDLASLKVQGSAHLPAANRTAWEALLDALRREDWKFEGVLDLAKLARLLPETLRLRPGTQITAGMVQVVAESGKAGGQRAWRGELTTANLAAVDGDRPIVWNQPLKVLFAAHDSPQGPVIDHLRADASFLQVVGQGTLDQGSLTAQGNLDQLVAELGRFVDLASLGMAGKLEGRAEWQRTAAKLFTASAQLAVANFQLTLPGQPPWREAQLAASLKATASGDFAGLTRLDTAEATLLSGQDRLDVQLTAPLVDINAKSAWPIKARLSGQLATWQPRLALVAPLTGTALAGLVSVDLQGAFAADRCDLASAAIDATQVQVRRADWQLDEPQLKLELAGALDLPGRAFTAKNLSLASTTLALQADALVARFPAGAAPILSGQVSYRGDLQRLQRWLPADNEPPAWAWTGQLSGDAQLVHEGDRTQANWNAKLESVALYQRAAPLRGPATIPAAADVNGGWQPAWNERQITFAGQAAYTGRDDRLQIDQVQLAAESLAFKAAGTMTGLTTRPAADLSGQVDYDLAQLAERFRGLLGPVRLAGRESRPFALRGPLLASSTAPLPTAAPPAAVPLGTPPPSAAVAVVSPELTGQAALGWQAIDLYGLPIGPGAFDCRLDKGIVTAPPLDVAIEEGRLRIAPRLVLNQSPMLLVLDQGRAVENVRISPELCRTWLKYVAPLLADATQVEGRFSVDLQAAAVPLANPGKASASGQLFVQGAHAGPGPLAQPLIGLVRQVKAILDKKNPLALVAPTQPVWLDLAEQKVDFQVVEGRVFHRHVTFQIGDVQVRTVGSVGFDQTLDLLAEIPVRDEWIAKEKALAGLRGQNLTIPIRGTFAQPKLDNKVLKDLAARLAGGFLEGLLTPKP